MQKKLERWWDWPSLIFLTGALLTATTRLLDSGWTKVLEPVQFVTLLGILLGALLGKSKFHWRVALWMALIFTIFFVPWRLGAIYDPLNWEKRLPLMADKLVSAVHTLSQNQPVKDPLLFVFAMSLLFWAFSLSAAFQLTRNARPWGGLLVAGIALAIIDYYNPAIDNRLTYGAFFVFFSLLLIGRIHFLRQRKEWQRQEVEYDLEAGYDQGRLLLVVGVLLVFVCWNMPSFVDLFNPDSQVRSEFDQTLDDLRSRIGNAMAGLQTAAVSSSDVYTSSFSAGQGGPLGEDLVFTAQLTQAPPATARLYWVGRTYEMYDGTRWYSNIDQRFPGLPGRWPFARPAYIGRVIVNMNIITNVDLMAAVYTPNLPLYSSYPVKVVAEAVSEDGAQGNITALMADPPLRTGQNFRLQAWITNASVEQLQMAGEEYPDWVVQRYLQLPEEIPTRVVQLAQQITIDAKTPYEKAEAVTKYLRDHITYVQAVPPVPQDRDMVDWFLFTQRAGFCNYYASAEVVLLRAMGVPARLAVGFAEGDSEITRDEFTIRRRHGHAWPEVYFPGTGWVEFEPTVTYPEIQRPETSQNSANPETPNPEETPDSEQNPEQSRGRSFAVPFTGGMPLVVVWGGFFVIIGSASTGLWLWTRRYHPDMASPLAPALEKFIARFGWHAPEWMRSRFQRAELLPVEKLFARVDLMLKLLGTPVDPSQTPLERVHRLYAAVPQTREPALVLLEQYHRSIYGPYVVDLGQAQQAHWQLWRIVFPIALRRKLHLS